MQVLDAAMRVCGSARPREGLAEHHTWCQQCLPGRGGGASGSAGHAASGAPPASAPGSRKYQPKGYSAIASDTAQPAPRRPASARPAASATKATCPISARLQRPALRVPDQRHHAPAARRRNAPIYMKAPATARRRCASARQDPREQPSGPRPAAAATPAARAISASRPWCARTGRGRRGVGAGGQLRIERLRHRAAAPAWPGPSGSAAPD